MTRKAPIAIAAAMTAAMSAAPAFAQDTSAMDLDTLYNLPNTEVAAGFRDECQELYAAGEVYTRCFDQQRDTAITVVSNYRAASVAAGIDWETNPVRTICNSAINKHAKKVKAHANMYVNEIHDYTFGMVGCAVTMSNDIESRKVIMSAAQVGALNELRTESYYQAFAADGFPSGVAAASEDRLGYMPTGKEMNLSTARLILAPNS